MRSIALATVWEFWRRCWPTLTCLMLTTLGMPALIYGILPSYVSYPREVALTVHLEFVFLLIAAGMLVIAVCAVHGVAPGAGGGGSPRRLYHLPIATGSLVLGQMLCGIAAVASSYLIVAVVINRLFPVQWPLAAPALFFATAYACVQATLWTLNHTRLLQIIALTIVSGALFFWLKSRYGPVFGTIEHAWPEPTGVEILTMLGLMVAAYSVAVWGVGRDRCGDTQGFIALWQWFDRPSERLARRPLSFRSAEQAQFWYEWRQKGGIMPGIFAFFLMVILVGYQFSDSRRIDLVIYLQAYGFGLGIVSLVVGLALGCASMPQGRSQCGPFLGTRPVTDTALAAAILKVSALSLLLAWALWVLTLLSATAWLWALEGSRAVDFAWQHLAPSRLSGWFSAMYFGSALLFAWTMFAVSGPLTMTGRHRLLVGVLTIGPGLMATYGIVKHLFLPAEFAVTADRIVGYGIASVLLAGIAAAMVLAERRGHVAPRTVWVAAGLWPVPPAIVLNSIWPDEIKSYEVGLALAVVFSALAVSPLATGPLAMAWNRHR